MKKRTQARELSLQFLYQIDIGKSEWAKELEDFEGFKKIKPEIKNFAYIIIEGTLKNLKSIDEVITKSTQNWRIKRMAIVDRNVLRLATFELLYRDDIPAKVSINEAINLAKKYGDSESGKFVNGILDRIKRDIVDKNNSKK